MVVLLAQLTASSSSAHLTVIGDYFVKTPIYFALAAFLLLAGCSTSVTTTLEQAKAESSPAQALRLIRHAQDDSCDDFWGFCEVQEDLVKAEREYFAAAARAGDTDALRELYLSKSTVWLALQEELRPGLLEQAKTASNPGLLVAAANLVGNDQIVVIDRARQILFLKRAWENGDKDAAGYIANLYANLKDYENAYLWSLRCTHSCSRSRGAESYFRQIGLDDLGKHLGGEQILKLQQEAARQTAS